MLRRFFALLMVLALSACGVSSASELPSEDEPERADVVDVSVFRDALANGRFAEFDNFQPQRALLAAGQSRILLVGTVRGFRLTSRTGSVVMGVRVEETLKGAGMVPGRRLRIDLGRRDNAPESARRANRGTVARYRAAVPEGSRFLVQLFPREGVHAGAGGSFKPYGPTALVFEGEDGIVGAYAGLPETWTEQRSLTGLRDEIFHRLRSDGTVCAPRLLYPQEVGGPLRLTFEDCLRREERRLDRKIRKACQGITRLRPQVRLSSPETDLDCLKVNIEG